MSVSSRIFIASRSIRPSSGTLSTRIRTNKGCTRPSTRRRRRKMGLTTEESGWKRLDYYCEGSELNPSVFPFSMMALHQIATLASISGDILFGHGLAAWYHGNIPEFPANCEGKVGLRANCLFSDFDCLSLSDIFSDRWNSRYWPRNSP